jgi:hypothetical protein
MFRLAWKGCAGYSPLSLVFTTLGPGKNFAIAGMLYTSVSVSPSFFSAAFFSSGYRR